jgi:hypothetical protein
MRRAAPSLWQQLPSVPHGGRALALFGAFAVMGACSVYSNDLLEEGTGLVAGGAGHTSAGDTSTLAGTSGANGGKNSGEVPGMGGQGGDGSSTGEAGDGGVANGGSPTGDGGVPTTAGVGGSNAGGTVGSSGGGTAGSSGGSTGPDVVDGFEDNDLTLEQTDGRGGVWYLVGDGTVGGKLTPSPLAPSPNSGAPAALGGYAMHVTATGFTGSGSILGADLRDQKLVYNASRFTGIRFWAKVAAGKNTKLRVQIADATTDKTGGKCVPLSTVPAEKCEDHFGYVATLTTSWAQYSILFKDMTQIGWGKSAPALDKAAVYGVQFTAKPVPDLDLWLDEIELF